MRPLPDCRLRVISGALLAIAAAVVSAPWKRAPGLAYVGNLQSRIAALRPAVERELSAKIPGRLRVAVATRGELAKQSNAEMRRLLTAIEGEPPIDFADGGGGTTIGVLGRVDDQGTIHICRQELEGTPLEGLLGMLPLHEVSKDARTPEALDRVLAHELVHVFQKRMLGAQALLLASRHRSDLEARLAILEGHADAVTRQVLGQATRSEESLSSLDPDPGGIGEMYAMFDVASDSWRRAVRYVQGRVFVESAIARLGRTDAVRRLFAEPPSLLQIEHPETWPGPGAPDTGTDAMLHRMRRWLADEWRDTECDPLPPAGFLHLLRTADEESRGAAAAALVEVQRIEASGPRLGHRVAGHLLAARDEAGARTLLKAWIAAARARDELIPSDPKFRLGGVRWSSWSTGALDGSPVELAERTYARMDMVAESAVVVRKGRHVLELRLAEDPGGTAAALRIARRLLACVVDAPRRAAPDAPDWQSRWRFASDSQSPPNQLIPLLRDADADVRHAAVSNLLRLGKLDVDRRAAARADPDPLVRLTALTSNDPGVDPPTDHLLAAIADPHPWVAAGGLLVVDCPHLSSTQGYEIPDALLETAMRRPEVAVRRAAACVVGDGFGQHAPGLRLALVRGALSDTDAAVRERAAEALLFLPSDTPDLGATFVEILEGDDEMLVDDALRYLSIREGVPGTVDALVPYLDRAEHRSDALEALGKLPMEARPIVPRLLELAAKAEHDDDLQLRLAALAAVAQITRDRTELMRVVDELLASGTDEEATRAVRLLNELEIVRARLVPPLVRRLGSGDRYLDLAILNALERHGSLAESAVPAIHELRRSADPMLREAAKRAQGKIEKARARYEGRD